MDELILSRVDKVRQVQKYGKSLAHCDGRGLQAALISEDDLREAMRKRFGDDDLQRLEQAVLERDGEVSLRRRPVSESRTTGAAGPGSRPDSAL